MPEDDVNKVSVIGEFGTMRRGAVITCGGTYRYDLLRQWGSPDGPQICWVMLNPSTADASVDDPTIRRCIGFSKGWGFDSLVVVNLFALRSADPKALLTSEFDPIGPENDIYIEHAVERAECVMAAWGTKGSYLGRNGKVTDLITRTGKTMHCLDRTKDGHPKHPLYVKGDTCPGYFALGHSGRYRTPSEEGS